MKHKPSIILWLTSAILLINLKLYAQSPGFVEQDNVKVAGVTTDAQLYALPINQKQTTRVFFDGLGRGVQAVAVQASPLQNDLIQPVAYDNLGRQTTAYLPYAGKSTDVMGSYRANAVSTDQAAFYNQTSQYLVATDAAPYNQQVFENSPLQRLLSSGMVGTGFQPVSGQHYKTASYRPNNSGDGNILVWNPDGTYTSGTYYAANTLSVTDGKDEDNVETQSFTDLAGHMVLKRQLLSSGNLDTYYVYNVSGMLIYTIPPLATAKLTTYSYSLTTAPLNKLVFHFVYDTRGRIVEKTAPSKGVMYIVYDPMNRPVLMQDSNMRASYNWNYIKYDVKGRAISQGIYTDGTAGRTTRAGMQTYVSGPASGYATAWYESRSASNTYNYYTNNVFPAANIQPLAYAYFDDYNVTNQTSPTFTYVTQGLTGEEIPTTAAVKGMPTAITQTTVGSGITSNQWFTKAIFYDKRGNPIQTQSNNAVYYSGIFAMTDYSTVVPDFTGVPQVTKVSKQTAASTTATVQTNLTYDQVNRITAVDQYYNGSPIISHVAGYAYNEIGQVIKKNLGNYSSSESANLTLNTAYSGTNSFIATSSITLSPGFSVPSGSTFNASISPGYLQTVDMRYNIRGQLLSINNSQLSNDGGVTNNGTNDVFGMAMLYDQADANLGNTAYYDGKLSGVKWMSKNSTGGRSWERGYKYSYDGINRYTSAIYAERDTINTGTFSNNAGGFNEALSYDMGGNITTLTRNASTQGTNSNVQIDNLAYSYNNSSNPNQLQSVTDGTDANHTGAGFRNLTGSTGSYAYDGNGNLSADPYKGLTLVYDVLNKTDKITVTTGTNRWIDYTYDALGKVLRKRQYDNNILQNTTDYINGFVYINGTLSYFAMPEGRVLNTGSGGTVTLKQEFIVTDQQGNARVSFMANSNGTAVVTQENSYYASGLIMPNSPVATPTTPNKQLYNGGSEWQNDYSNLPDYYQTFNRNYDAAIMRFVGVDPMAESAESMTTYQYAGNNPVMFNDPLGNNKAPWDNPPAQFWSPLYYDQGVAGQEQQDMGAYESYYGAGGAGSAGDGNGGFNGSLGGYAGGAWQNAGAFDDNSSFSNDNGAAGRAFWLPAILSGGDLQATGVYHAGDGTAADPASGMNFAQLSYLITGSANNAYMMAHYAGHVLNFSSDGTLTNDSPEDPYAENGVIAYQNGIIISSFEAVEDLLGQPISATNEGFDYLDLGNKANALYGAAVTAADLARITGTLRIGTKTITGLGVAGGIAGTALDGVGVYNYYHHTAENINSRVSPYKFTVDGGMTALGIWGGPPGEGTAALYFGIDAFYPGGVAGFGKAQVSEPIDGVVLTGSL